MWKVHTLRKGKSSLNGFIIIRDGEFPKGFTFLVKSDLESFPLKTTHWRCFHLTVFLCRFYRKSFYMSCHPCRRWLSVPFSSTRCLVYAFFSFLHSKTCEVLVFFCRFYLSLFTHYNVVSFAEIIICRLVNLSVLFVFQLFLSMKTFVCRLLHLFCSFLSFSYLVLFIVVVLVIVVLFYIIVVLSL